MENQSITPRTAYISGASRGIGEAIARTLASDGWNLILTCHHQLEKLQSLAEELRETYGVDVLYFQCDAGNYKETYKVASVALEHFGSIDAVINNAGISKVGLLTELTYEEWDEVLSTNLSSAFYTAKAFLPSMIQRKQGRIINISSMWGTAGASCEVAYSASKGGLNTFTKALAKELAPSGISVNSVACGVIDTDMNKIFTDEEKSALCEEIPAGRFASAEEVAILVQKLLETPTYLTGQIIGMDGGYL